MVDFPAPMKPTKKMGTRSLALDCRSSLIPYFQGPGNCPPKGGTANFPSPLRTSHHSALRVVHHHGPFLSEFRKDVVELWQRDSSTIGVLDFCGAHGNESCYRKRHCNPVIALTGNSTTCQLLRAVDRKAIIEFLYSPAHRPDAFDDRPYPVALLYPQLLSSSNLGTAGNPS